MLTENLIDNFRRLYGGEPRVFSAPGRVNLIGEHTDYNNGYVLPMTINRRTYVAAAKRSDRMIRASSTSFEDAIEFELSLDMRPGNDWGNHIRGIAACLLQDEFDLFGADLLIDSDVPLGAGLSSSAALEISVGHALISINDQQLNPVDLALIAQRGEQQFAGTQCGIMDQYICCLGVKDHALLIDCRDLDYRAVPLDLEQARVVVCNSMVKHDLAASAYNQRRAECEAGVRALARYLPGIESLRDVAIEDFDRYADHLPDTIRRRCHHVIAENARVLSSVVALETGDLAQFGRLMTASHESLRDEYEVSCPELDLLVEIASQFSGVFGARMTGGGFGGCTVNLVAKDAVEEFISWVERSYQIGTGLRPESYICAAVEGVKEEV